MFISRSGSVGNKEDGTTSKILISDGSKKRNVENSNASTSSADNMPPPCKKRKLNTTSAALKSEVPGLFPSSNMASANLSQHPTQAADSQVTISSDNPTQSADNPPSPAVGSHVKITSDLPVSTQIPHLWNETVTTGEMAHKLIKDTKEKVVLVKSTERIPVMAAFDTHTTKDVATTSVTINSTGGLPPSQSVLF